MPSWSVSLPKSEHTPVPASSLSRWFVEEVQPHERSLRSYLRSAFPSLPDIDDVVQESYALLIRAKEAGRVSYVKAFLFSCAPNSGGSKTEQKPKSFYT